MTHARTKWILATIAFAALFVMGGLWVSSAQADPAPKIEVDPETYTVKADGRELRCEPASVLPLAQRYFLF